MIIGFTGKAGVGKTTCANYTSHSVISFAGELKRIAFIMGWDGEKDVKGRTLLQDLGDIGRKYDPEMWVLPIVTECISHEENVVFVGTDYILSVDDVRYDNEAKILKSLGGIIIHLEGDGYDLGKLSEHPSEKGVGEKHRDYSIPWDDLKVVFATLDNIVIEEKGKRAIE